MASLLMLKGVTQGQRLSLDGELFTLGRNPDCSVVIAGSAVSREHARIVRVGGQFYVEDNQSRNGTFVNNQQITGRTLLKNNDRIKICDFLCTFQDDAPPAKPLPAGLGPEEEPEEDPAGSSTVEASLSRLSHQQLLETQPAEKLKALLEISNSLSKTLELDSLLPKIADNLFQLFRQGDRCFLILLDETGTKLIPKLIKARRATTEANARFSRSIVRQCIEKGEAFLSEDATTDSRFGLSQSIADFRIRSVMCAPLTGTEGKAFGVIQLDTQDRTKKFTAEDLKLLVGVGNQAAIALENAKLHETLVERERFQRDLVLARQVQVSFLPQRLPDVPGYEFFAYYEAAQQVGGDYYDFVPLGGKRLAIMQGDVAGKGVPAALLMAKISAEARFSVLTEPDPAQAITKLNISLCRGGMLDRFVTFAACVLDPVRHLTTVINAGHMTPLVYRHATGKLEDAHTDAVAGLPLGVMEGYEYAAFQVELRQGDTLFVYTDGVTDAWDLHKAAFHVKGIHAAIAGHSAVDEPTSPTALGKRIIKAVKQHSDGMAQHDDITLIGFGRVTSLSDTGPLPHLKPGLAAPPG